MKKILLAIALLASTMQVSAQTRVVILTDFPPVDVVPGGMGFGDAEKLWQESWGGKFVQPDNHKNHWYDAPGGGANVYKWRQEVQDDFAKRADWMLP